MYLQLTRSPGRARVPAGAARRRPPPPAAARRRPPPPEAWPTPVVLTGGASYVVSMPDHVPGALGALL
ncbi:MAG: hypothetical protein ACYC2G_06740, partial [Gemmatimonadaceae bacterium]